MGFSVAVNVAVEACRSSCCNVRNVTLVFPHEVDIAHLIGLGRTGD
jgi:hypothetical protein